MRIDIALRRESLQQRLEIHNDDSLVEPRQCREHAQTLRNDIRMRREQVVWQSLPIRETFDVEPRLAEEAELILEAPGLRSTRGDDQQWARSRTGGFGKPEGRG